MTGAKQEKSRISADSVIKKNSLQSKLIEDLFNEYFHESDNGSVTNNLKTILSRILETLEQCIAICTLPDFKILYFTSSMAELLGIKAKKQLEIPLNKYLQPKSKSNFLKQLNELKPDGSVLNTELNIFQNNKLKGKASFSIQKIALHEKSIIFISSSFRDDDTAAGEKIRQSEERYRTLVENIQGVVFAVDTNAVLQYASPSVEKLTGYQPKEVVGKPFQVFIHPEDLPALMESYISTLKGNPYTLEYRVKKKKGDYLWVYGYSTLVGTVDKPKGVNGFLVDIHVRKVLEEELKKSRRNLETFFNSIDEFLFVLDEKARIIQTNKVVLKRLGYSENDLKGKSIIELHPQEFRKKAKAVIKKILSGSEDLCTLPLITKSGKNISVETVVTRGEWGGQKVIFGVSRDVSKRMEIEEALRLKTEELDRYFSSTIDLLCIADTDGYFRRLNPQWESTLGWPIDKLERSRFLDFVHPDDLDATNEAVKSLSQQKEVLNFVNRYRCKDGSYKWIEWRSFPVGKLIYAAARDITEKKKASEALEESEKKYRALVDNAIAGIYIIQNGILKYGNDFLARMLGYNNPGEIIGRKVRTMTAPGSWTIVDSMMKKRENGELKSIQYGFQAIKKDGSFIDLEVLGSNIYLDGKPAVQGMMIDVTDRRRWEASLFSQLERIQRQQTSIVSLATNPSVISGNTNSAVKAVTEIASEALNVERVSIWLFNEAETEIYCIDLFERSSKKHSSGLTISVSDHPAYFKAITSGRGMDISDAVKDWRTSSFTEKYLLPNKISSMLDSPIRREGKIIGIICNEHTGDKRTWFLDEIIFAGETADQVLQILLNSERRKAIEAMHESEEQFSTFMNHLPAVVFLKDVEGRALYINKSFEEYFGKDWIGKTVFDKLPKEIAGPMDADDKLVLKSGVIDRVETITTIKGGKNIFRTLKFPVHRSGKSPLLGGLAIDFTYRAKSEEARKLNAERMQSLIKINQMADSPAKEIADFALDEGIRLTKSKFGFLAFLDENETKIKSFSWSKDVLKECELPYRSLIIPVSPTGLLSKVIKQRKPIITNDYSSPNNWKGGYPKGHINLHRIINIPIFSGSKIALIAGIANKEEEYNEEDSNQLTLLMEGMWNLIVRKQNEEIIQKREATLNSIFRAAPVGIGMVTNRILVEVNDTLCQMTGCSKDELLGKNSIILYPSKEEFDYVGKEKYRQIAEFGTGTVETKWRRKDGEILDILLSSTPLDPLNSNEEVTFTALDITKRKRAENALKENQLFLESIYNGAELPILVLDISEKGEYRIASMNPAYERLEVFKLQDVIGKTMEELIQLYPSYEESIKHISRNYDRCLKEGKSIQYEESLSFKGQESWWLTRLTPLYNSKGKIYRIVASTINITDSKKAEEALRMSEKSLRQIIDLVPHFIFAKDSDGKFIIVNKAVADAYGTTVNDLTGKKDADFARSEQEAEHFREDDIEVIKSGVQKVVPEEPITDSEGNKRLLHTTKIPFTTSDTISSGVLGVSVDITESKRIEKEREILIKELEAKNAELESFTYTVSHDLKSPLITIKGFIGMIESDLLSNESERLSSDLKRIREAADKMAELLDDLLELSRIGRVVKQPENVPLQMVVNDALTVLSWRLEKKNLQINVQPDLPIIFGDSRRLMEVFQNLIENAIKFMGAQRNPKIDIGVKMKAGEQVFFVKDNGIGIEPKYHETIFGLFNKLDAKSVGTGIGLALVKRIIEVHGGNVWVESKGLNKGSTFCFTIPPKNP